MASTSIIGIFLERKVVIQYGFSDDEFSNNRLTDIRLSIIPVLWNILTILSLFSLNFLKV